MQQHFFTLLFSIVLNVRATITGEKLLTAQLSSPQSLLIRVVYISLRKGCWRHPKSRISAEHPNFDPLICASSLVSCSGFVESNHQSISSCLETYMLYIYICASDIQRHRQCKGLLFLLGILNLLEWPITWDKLC
jgi:hypothetical protein